MQSISQKLIPYRTFLTAEKKRLSDLIHQLEQQNRQDEANLQKIHLNIVSIFETVASADEKQCATWTDFCLRYEPRFDTLTAPWRSRLAAALHHGDLETQTIEEEKLSAAKHIKSVFISMKEQRT